jgi:deoxyuridine 5'-triphosphate nucleotidohydrolase
VNTTHPRLEYFLIGFSGVYSGSHLHQKDKDYLGDLLGQVHSSSSQRDLLEGLVSFRHKFDECFASQLMLPDETRLAFLRGMFGGMVHMGFEESGQPYFVMLGGQDTKREAGARVLAGDSGVLLQVESGRVSGLSALDAAGRILGGDGPVLPSQAEMFGSWCARISQLETSYNPRAAIRVQRVHPDAQLPKKERISDSGYDLTLLYAKTSWGRTVLYGTGLIVEPPLGWYLDVVPRSSIIKRGYILANSVGIIDRSYRGEILVPLIKIDPEAPDLELPARVAQLIPRPIVHFPLHESQELSATERGAGGFGSTGK